MQKMADRGTKAPKLFKLQFAHLISEASKTIQLGLFNFRSFLNIGMSHSKTKTLNVKRYNVRT